MLSYFGEMLFIDISETAEKRYDIYFVLDIEDFRKVK
jgi:hypothetical protein